MAAGEMSRGADDFKARFFDDPSARSVKFGAPKAKTNQKDTPQTLEADSGICYYTAALESEQALEASMPDGKRHGLFTYAVLTNLKDGKLWGDVHSGVKKTMGSRLENTGRTQNPMISTKYLAAEVLDSAAKPGEILAPSKSLLDVWNEDNPQVGKIALRMKPDENVIEVGRQLGLEIEVGQDGYLIVLGQVGEHFYQFYPAGSHDAADAAVKKGTITFPGAGQNLFFDDFGADHLKAMLFSSREAAQTVLQAVRTSGGKATAVQLTQGIKQPAFTSRLSVAVGDSLIGGLRFKNLDGLYAKLLSQDTNLSRFLIGKMHDACRGYDKGLAWLLNAKATDPPKLADLEAFVTSINLAVQAGLLYDEAAFKGVKLPKKVKQSLKTPGTGESLWELNRAILAVAYPGEVNPDDARSH